MSPEKELIMMAIKWEFEAKALKEQADKKKGQPEGIAALASAQTLVSCAAELRLQAQK